MKEGSLFSDQPAEYLRHAYHHTLQRWPPLTRLAPELVIVHDDDEDEETIGPEGWLHKEAIVGMLTWERGFCVYMKRPPFSEVPRGRGSWQPSAATELLVVYAPPYNALWQKHFGSGGCGWADALRAEHHVSDHRFSRREAAPGDGGDNVIRRALARCHGCFAPGYHLPTTEIRCTAYGVPEPAPPAPGSRPWEAYMSEEEVRADRDVRQRLAEPQAEPAQPRAGDGAGSRPARP